MTVLSQPLKKISWCNDLRQISELLPATYNPRKLTESQAKQLNESIERFDLADPIIINLNNVVIGGHQRIKILKTRGVTECAVRIPDRLLTDDEERELNLRLNKNLGEWDLQLLGDFDKDMLFDVGFDSSELDKIFPVVADPKDDEVPETDKNEFGVVRGDIWQLGRHRLMCGDSTSTDDVGRLMDGKKADMVFTDPPYNVDYSGRGKETRNKIKNDNMSFDDFAKFLNDVFVNYKMFSKVGSSIYVCHTDGKAMVRATFEEQFNKSFKQSATIIWVKNLASMGWQHYRGQHEPILYGWNDEQGQFFGDRNETTVWNVKRDSKYKHPTQKPIDLIVRAVKNSSKHDDICLDLFLGSGSTLIACEKTNRICYGMEIDEHYCSVIIKRWQEFTNQEAKRV